MIQEPFNLKSAASTFLKGSLKCTGGSLILPFGIFIAAIQSSKEMRDMRPDYMPPSATDGPGKFASFGFIVVSDGMKDLKMAVLEAKEALAPLPVSSLITTIRAKRKRLGGKSAKV
jgi:hypothetical protein